MKIETVEDLIKALSKFPKEFKIEVEVDKAYRSYVNNIYIDQYEKKQGRNVVTIAV